MRVGMPSLDKTLWMLNIAVQVVLLAVLVARKEHRRFPAFCAYLGVNLLQALLFAMMFSFSEYVAPRAWKIGWASQAVVVAARVLAVGELCRHALARYRGVWALGWRLLTGLALGVLVFAVALGGFDLRSGVVTLDLGSELAIAAATAGLFAFAKYYDVLVEEPTRTMGAAFCLYSCCYVLNDLLLKHYLSNYERIWNLAGMAAFFATVCLWGWAFRAPVRSQARKPVLLQPDVYRHLIPEMNRSLADLNEQLSHFWNVRSPHT